ncbi:hypothetical protein P22_3890 [Propionispora sp. 2/2-37]|uniref:stage II sporulation protein P n=1 Tax=Propionispora sp. 2/2-37 TaxID=1677858 RepID=UPI0006BB8307|nr:stage II sporulation protein P [Propionispora sp. 2/2-37]CUH97746.1 hypothetical protein P22_3890 [Propionispora sp. 2/2-37]
MPKLFAILISVTYLALSAPPIAVASPPLETELSQDYITVVDEQNNVLLQTGIQVHEGDIYIAEDNQTYQIFTINEMQAVARLLTTPLSSAGEPPAITASSTNSPPPLIAVYHTHTDEAYIPTDGVPIKKGDGSIMEVGAAFADRLQQLGYQTLHDKTLHDPHDANAYHRSRRTVLRMLKKNPAALFDFHRDSAPAKAYQLSFNGKPATKLLLVVGQQNQNRKTTENFAKQIKTAADAKYKGLIRGIFIARGNYNQDLSPKAILVEVGTQYNSRPAAEYSAALFADIIPSLLPLPAPKTPSAQSIPDNAAKQAETPPENQITDTETADNTADSAVYDILVLIFLVLAASALYLYLSTGSLKEARQKLQKLRTTEFNDIWRRFRKKIKD